MAKKNFSDALKEALLENNMSAVDLCEQLGWRKKRIYEICYRQALAQEELIQLLNHPEVGPSLKETMKRKTKPRIVFRSEAMMASQAQRIETQRKNRMKKKRSRKTELTPPISEPVVKAPAALSDAFSYATKLVRVAYGDTAHDVIDVLRYAKENNVNLDTVIAALESFSRQTGFPLVLKSS